MRAFLPTFQRIVLALLQVLLCLPFAAVTECGSRHTVEYTGVGLMTVRDAGILLGFWYVIPTGLLIAFAYRPQTERWQDALALSWRAMAAGMATVLALFCPWFFAILEYVELRWGWWVFAGAWLAVELAYLLASWVAVFRLSEEDRPAAAEPVLAWLIGGLALAAGLRMGFRVSPDRAVPWLDLTMALAIALPLATCGLVIGWNVENQRLFGGFRLGWRLMAILFCGMMVAGIVG